MDELKGTRVGVRRERRGGRNERGVGTKELGKQLVSTLSKETWKG